MSLTRSSAVLELGKKLVAQLDCHDDLLASWMAHHVAQRIEEAENARAEAKLLAEDACAKAVLDLWRHRSSLPHHLRPLAELEPIQRTLTSLDVDRTDYRYYPAVLHETATAGATEDDKRWLELAIGLDYSARLLIQSALRTAAQRATSLAEPWVELAARAGADEGAERLIVRFVRGAADEAETDQARQDSALMDQVSRLEGFASLAMQIVKSIRAELGSDSGEDD